MSEDFDLDIFSSIGAISQTPVSGISSLAQNEKPTRKNTSTFTIATSNNQFVLEKTTPGSIIPMKSDIIVQEPQGGDDSGDDGDDDNDTTDEKTNTKQNIPKGKIKQQTIKAATRLSFLHYARYKLNEEVTKRLEAIKAQVNTTIQDMWKEHKKKYSNPSSYTIKGWFVDNLNTIRASLTEEEKFILEKYICLNNIRNITKYYFTQPNSIIINGFPASATLASIAAWLKSEIENAKISEFEQCQAEKKKLSKNQKASLKINKKHHEIMKPLQDYGIVNIFMSRKSLDDASFAGYIYVQFRYFKLRRSFFEHYNLKSKSTKSEKSDDSKLCKKYENHKLTIMSCDPTPKFFEKKIREEEDVFNFYISKQHPYYSSVIQNIIKKHTQARENVLRGETEQKVTDQEKIRDKALHTIRNEIKKTTEFLSRIVPDLDAKKRMLEAITEDVRPKVVQNSENPETPETKDKHHEDDDESDYSDEEEKARDELDGDNLFSVITTKKSKKQKVSHEDMHDETATITIPASALMHLDVESADMNDGHKEKEKKQEKELLPWHSLKNIELRDTLTLFSTLGAVFKPSIKSEKILMKDYITSMIDPTTKDVKVDTFITNPRDAKHLSNSKSKGDKYKPTGKKNYKPKDKQSKSTTKTTKAPQMKDITGKKEVVHKKSQTEKKNTVQKKEIIQKKNSVQMKDTTHKKEVIKKDTAPKKDISKAVTQKKEKKVDKSKANKIK